VHTAKSGDKERESVALVKKRRGLNARHPQPSAEAACLINTVANGGIISDPLIQERRLAERGQLSKPDNFEKKCLTNNNFGSHCTAGNSSTLHSWLGKVVARQVICGLNGVKIFGVCCQTNIPCLSFVFWEVGLVYSDPWNCGVLRALFVITDWRTDFRAIRGKFPANAAEDFFSFDWSTNISTAQTAFIRVTNLNCIRRPAQSHGHLTVNVARGLMT
jgi:hypothetical protein